MDALSAAQFEMIRRGSDAAVHQTKPILGTVRKVADALGYQLGRKTEEHVELDAHGNRVKGRVQTSRGFRTTTTGYDRNGVTGETKGYRGVPGPLGGSRNTTVVRGQNPVPPPYPPGYPPPGAPPAGPTPHPNGPFPPPPPPPAAGPTVQPPGPMPQPPGTPQGRAQTRLNYALNPTQPLRTPPFVGPPAPPLPFNGSPHGRSDYGPPQ